jgi:hypothetical protein
MVSAKKLLLILLVTFTIEDKGGDWVSPIILISYENGAL